MQRKKGKILIIDDDEDVLVTARMILRNYYEKVLTEASPKKLESLLKKESIDVIILDMNFKTGATSGNEGLYWLRQIKKWDKATQVIMNTAYGDIQLAVACMKEGAIDFLVKPWEKEKLLTTVNNVFQLNESKKKIHRLEQTKEVLNKDIEQALGKMVGQSQAMKEVFSTIRKVAHTDANVLILGENGTGKELVARAIHHLSDRSSKDFVKVDLGALSLNLFESELFGHVKGAFTDAKTDRAGRFQLADEGTLFLDEIGNISLAHQVKLLSALQNRQVTPLGSSQAIDTNIRLIAATNKALDRMVEEQTFRQDLLYRINTITIELPPLRQRHGDIELLANYYLELYSKKYEKPRLKLSKDTIKKLNDYEWPGNIRELQHATERAVILSEGTNIIPDDIIPKKSKESPKDVHTLNVRDVEREVIVKAIEKHDSNLTRAARDLGMGRSTLYRKMEKYNIRA